MALPQGKYNRLCNATIIIAATNRRLVSGLRSSIIYPVLCRNPCTL